MNADQLQLEALRAMTPVERFRLGCRMIELALAARDARLCRQNPNATPEELDELRKRDSLDNYRDDGPGRT